MKGQILLELTRYIGVFKRQDKRGRWYKFHQIGNAGVAWDTAQLLRKLGHKVVVSDLDTEGDV